MHIVNAPSEAVADVNTAAAPLDIEVLFRAHYSRVARIIERVVHAIAGDLKSLPWKFF